MCMYVCIYIYTYVYNVFVETETPIIIASRQLFLKDTRVHRAYKIYIILYFNIIL